VSTVAALFRAAVGSIRVGYLENFVSRCDLSLLDDALPVQSCRAAGTISRNIGTYTRADAELYAEFGFRSRPPAGFATDISKYRGCDPPQALSGNPNISATVPDSEWPNAREISRQSWSQIHKLRRIIG